MILQPGQRYVAGGGGDIVVQPVPVLNAPDEIALGTMTGMFADAGLKVCRGRKAAAHTRIGIDLAAADRTEGVFEKCNGAGIPSDFSASDPCDFAGETPVHRRLEARATIIQTRSEWLEQLVFITLWLCSFFGVGYCLKAVLSLF